jgi:hypothetical protein
MAISVVVRPSLIVAGQVIATTPRQEYDEATRQRTDVVIGYNVSIAQENGATVQVRYSLEDIVPDVLDKVAVIVDVQESRQYGAFLVFQRNVLADDLDRINSLLPAKV